MRHLMIDIETAGVDHDAIMLQLGACFFNPETGETGAEFCENIDFNSCKELGFTTTQSTLDWWKKQDPKIVEQMGINRRKISDVMQKFSDFLGERNDLFIWSHATFDFVIVQNYLKKLKQGHFVHKNARDIRTLVDLSGINLNSYDWSKKTHNALDDCKFQVKYCTDAYVKLKMTELLK